jgi:hypothetical protein
VYYHTYQLKEERAYRVVLKYLHHTTEIEDIRQDLLHHGHVARNIVNAHHRKTKEPLNLFFVDLEPAKINKDVYKVTTIQNKIIYIEPPRTNKNYIPQCARCQQYGHTRASNAAANTIMQIARNPGIPQKKSPFAAETIRPTTKDANAITISSAVEIHTETPQP